MSYYWFVFSIVLSWIFLAELFSVKSKYIDTCFLLFLIFFSGLRYNADNDYLSYQQMFNAISYESSLVEAMRVADIWQVEKGFFLFLFVVKRTFNEFFIVTLFSSFLTIILIWKSFRSLSPRYYRYAFYLYFCTLYFTQPFMQIRFGLASAFISFFIALCLNDKNSKYFISKILVFSLAISNHLISIFAIFLIPFKKIVQKFNLFFIIIFSSLFVYFFIDLSFFLLLMTNISSRYISYLSEESDVSNMLIFVALMLLFYYFLTYKKKCSEGDITVYTTLYMLVVMGALGKYGVLNRASLLFYPVFFCFFSNLQGRIKVMEFKFLFFLFTVVIGAIKFIPTLNYLNEYKTIFE
ncbi:EpsG family protein [Aeromonas veronii]